MSRSCFTHRLAQPDDIPAIKALMQAAIEINMRGFLNEAEIKSASETMGVDNSLIEDQTYFLIETVERAQTVLVGCGGWGKRRTLYGGNATKGRDDTLSNPRTEPARIRAMYTHPDWTRQGIGKYLIALGENEARLAGFHTIELGSTVPGEPLYKAMAYVEIGRQQHLGKNGEANVIIHMRKAL